METITLKTKVVSQTIEKIDYQVPEILIKIIKQIQLYRAVDEGKDNFWLDFYELSENPGRIQRFHSILITKQVYQTVSKLDSEDILSFYETLPEIFGDLSFLEKANSLTTYK